MNAFDKCSEIALREELTPSAIPETLLAHSIEVCLPNAMISNQEVLLV
jgi:hypothetical protein